MVCTVLEYSNINKGIVVQQAGWYSSTGTKGRVTSEVE